LVLAQPRRRPAVLLGELLDVGGARRDLHLKGSGATPFARGGDGKAVVGPMLREYVIGEAMHALGVPTSRALAVVATGEEVVRETMLPGAVLARVAASHLRVGTFEYAATRGGPALVRRLANYAIARHYPQAAEAENPHLVFLEAVVGAQASLIARWMQVGFIHGVMNTDNMTISGETIDYGPCAFMDVFDPATVFSSIDETGRYAYGNQPRVAQWNLVRLAEALLATLHVEHDAAVAAATGVLRSFPERYDEFWRRGMRTKLGLTIEGPQDTTLSTTCCRSCRHNTSTTPLVCGCCPRGCAESRPQSGRCSPSPMFSTSGRSAGAESSPPSPRMRTRSQRGWTGSTPSTSRATTLWRKHSRPPASGI